MVNHSKAENERFELIAAHWHERICAGNFMWSEYFTEKDVNQQYGHGPIGTSNAMRLLVQRGILTQSGETFTVTKTGSANV